MKCRNVRIREALSEYGNKVGKTAAAVLLLLLGVQGASAAAEEGAAPAPLTFRELVDVGGNGPDLMHQALNRTDESGEPVATYEIAADLRSEVELLRVLLNETVLAQARNLALKDADVLLHSHLAWLQHWEKNPSRPGLKEAEGAGELEGAMTDYRRIRARLDAVRLSWNHYKVYGKIANACYVQVGEEFLRMKYGEVRRVSDAPWCRDPQAVAKFGSKVVEYPVMLLAGTCHIVKNGQKVFFCAVIVRNGDQAPHFCVWNADGTPHAVYRLNAENQTGRIVRQVVIRGDVAEVQMSDGETLPFNVASGNHEKIVQ